LAGVQRRRDCWFETGVTDSWGSGLNPLPCLGFLPGACCPHYNGEASDGPPCIADRARHDGHCARLDDGAAAHFVNGTLANIVSLST
jgi:peptidase E